MLSSIYVEFIVKKKLLEALQVEINHIFPLVKPK